jgi:hypothetical protein
MGLQTAHDLRVCDFTSPLMCLLCWSCCAFDFVPSALRLRRTPSQTKAASDERHARAERLREQFAEARLARLQEQLSKQQRRVAASKV